MSQHAFQLFLIPEYQVRSMFSNAVYSENANRLYNIKGTFRWNTDGNSIDIVYITFLHRPPIWVNGQEIIPLPYQSPVYRTTCQANTELYDLIMAEADTDTD